MKPDDVVQKACRRKRGMGSGAARAGAARMRAYGLHVWAYKCPFGCGRYHIGYVPNLQGLQDIADAIRNPPWRNSQPHANASNRQSS